jgi:hypothetical protein
MICDNLRVHWTGVFLHLMLLRMIVVFARGIEVNRPYLCAGANRERHRTNENKNPSLYIESHGFCSGSRVGCEQSAEMQAARLPLQRKFATPKGFRGLLG